MRKRERGRVVVGLRDYIMQNHTEVRSYLYQQLRKGTRDSHDTIEDYVSDTLERIYRKHADYRGDPSDIVYMKLWMRRVALNVAYKKHSKYTSRLEKLNGVRHLFMDKQHSDTAKAVEYRLLVEQVTRRVSEMPPYLKNTFLYLTGNSSTAPAHTQITCRLRSELRDFKEQL